MSNSEVIGPEAQQEAHSVSTSLPSPIILLRSISETMEGPTDNAPSLPWCLLLLMYMNH